MNLAKKRQYIFGAHLNHARAPRMIPCWHAFGIDLKIVFVDAPRRQNLKDIRLIATEINPHAARCAKMNGIEVIRTDLFKGLKPRHQETRFDLILFNPPYLPTSKEEKIPGWLNYAFDGGTSGRETLDRFLDEVRDYLKPGGKILVLISSITGMEAVKEKMEKLGFVVEVVARKKVSFEELIVVRGKLR